MGQPDRAARSSESGGEGMARQRRRRSVSVVVSSTAFLLLVATAGFPASLVSDQVVSPSAAHFPQNKQNESPMAVSPFNSNVVASGANDEIQEPDCTVSDGASSCPFDPQTDSTGVYVSTDGGSSYNDYILDWYPAFGTVSNGDPVIAFGPKPNHASNADGGRLYAGGIAIPPDAAANEGQYAIAWSDDQGQTWSAPVNISSRGSKSDFNDKPSLWVDANPASPNYGNVYAAWTLFTGNGNFGKSSTFSPEPIMFSRSTDFGKTWSNAQKIAQYSRNNGSNNGRQDSLIRSGPDGSVYVVWGDSVNKTSQLTFAKSTDGGKTFSQARGFAPVLDNPSPLPGASFRDGSPPAGDISQGTGAIYVTWTDYDTTAGHGVVRLARSTNGGTSWTTSTVADVAGRSPFFPSVAVTPDGSKVIVAFPTVNDVAADTT